MSSNQSTPQRDIYQKGNFVVGYQENGYVLSQNELTYNEKSDVSEDMRAIMTFLSDQFPDATPSEKEIHLKGQIQRQVKQSPSFKKKLLSAIEAGSSELVKVLTQNTFISVSIETVRGWIQAQ